MTTKQLVSPQFQTQIVESRSISALDSTLNKIETIYSQDLMIRKSCVTDRTQRYI